MDLSEANKRKIRSFSILDVRSQVVLLFMCTVYGRGTSLDLTWRIWACHGVCEQIE